MANNLEGWDDTIVALATPPGIGAIGVIRLSGGQAWTIAAALFPSKDLRVQEPHTLHVGLLRDQGVLLDEAVVSLFRGPRSYTGEDVVELHGHGGPVIIETLIARMMELGARRANPGDSAASDRDIRGQRAFARHGRCAQDR